MRMILDELISIFLILLSISGIAFVIFSACALSSDISRMEEDDERKKDDKGD